MNGAIHLVLFGSGGSELSWPHGEVIQVMESPRALSRGLSQCSSKPSAWLFWDLRLGDPASVPLKEIMKSRGDSWHCGLKLNLQQLPALNDYVSTTWMLNCNADPQLSSSSWRLTLRCALIKQEVIDKLGFIDEDFETLDGAALELGHRYMANGVLLRHEPSFCEGPAAMHPHLPTTDEVRFLVRRFGKFWARWGLLRASLSGQLRSSLLPKYFSLIRRIPSPAQHPPYHDRTTAEYPELEKGRVSILIPTLNRYPYLRKLLSQLRDQTIPPHEIIVVDQSTQENRLEKIQDDFQDLPLKWIYRDQPGQCSSRNEGIQSATGDLLLLLDDDLEVKRDLIEIHLKSLKRFRADASCGVLEEVGAGQLPPNFSLIRTSDVFPGSNTMVKLSVLESSGLFDLAYERGARADGDLGTRVYLSGALIVLNPDSSVIHHHAPTGGLRFHKARVITYASSRSQIKHRHLPAVTEIYLARRYHPEHVVKEMLWARALGTYAIRGSIFKKLSKFFLSTVLMPGTIREIKSRSQKANEMLTRYPQIPQLNQRSVMQVPY